MVNTPYLRVDEHSDRTLKKKVKAKLIMNKRKANEGWVYRQVFSLPEGKSYFKILVKQFHKI